MSAKNNILIKGQPTGAALPEELPRIEDIVRRYHGALLGFLRRRLRNEQDVADASQETYTRLIDYCGRQTTSSPGGLLFRIAAHVVEDQARRNRSRCSSSHCSIDDMELVSDEVPRDRQLHAEQELARLAEAIEQLPRKCQQVFLLSRVYQLKYPEIAEHCGISVKMVEKHIGRALLELRIKAGHEVG